MPKYIKKCLFEDGTVKTEVIEEDVRFVLGDPYWCSGPGGHHTMIIDREDRIDKTFQRYIRSAIVDARKEYRDAKKKYDCLLELFKRLKEEEGSK